MEKLKKTDIAKTWGMQWEKLKLLYVLQVIYIVIWFLLLNPLFGKIINQLLKKKGYSYFTTEMMLDFFTSPLVICVVLFLLLVAIFLFVWLHAFVYQYVKEQYSNSYDNLFTTVYRTSAMLLRVVRGGGYGLLLTLVAGVLFQNSITFCLAARYIPSIWYIVKLFLELKYTKLVFAALFALLLVYYVRHLFTIPSLVFERNSYKEAKEKGIDILRKTPFWSLTHWIFWVLATGAFTVAFYFITIGIASVVIVLFVSLELRGAVFHTVQEHIYVLTLLCSLVFGMSLQVTANVQSFVSYYKKQGECYPHEEQEEKVLFPLGKRFLIVAFILLLCVDIVTIHDTVRNGGNVTYEHFGAITVTSHRGDSRNAPENTLPAVELAMDTGTDYIEIDVQETKDGEVVLMHDSNLARTTGVNKQVCQMTYAELSRLDAGSWFSDEYAGTQIPTLRQVLEICKGKCKLNIEIKANKRTPDLEEKVVQLIDEYDFARQCVITSVYKDSLRKVKKYNDEIRTGYILSSAYGRYYLDKEIDFLSMRSTLVTERVVRLAHKNGKEVCVWTVNTRKTALLMSQLGVDNIITDRPAYIRNLLYEEKGMDTILSLFKYVY